MRELHKHAVLKKPNAHSVTASNLQPHQIIHFFCSSKSNPFQTGASPPPASCCTRNAPLPPVGACDAPLL
jgi:hypothetical protein